MTWREAQLSLQVDAEVRYGAPRRREAYEARAAEDAAAAAVITALRGKG